MEYNKKFELKLVPLDHAWDNFLDRSSFPNLFMKSFFVEALSINYCAYGCFKGNERVAQILLVLDFDKIRVTGHDKIVYDGVFIPINNSFNIAKRTSWKMEVMSFIVEELYLIYKDINLKLHFENEDVRAFSWFNFGLKKPRYNIEPKYTTILNISELSTKQNVLETDIFKNLSYSRRQEVRNSISQNISTWRLKDTVSFIKLYNETFAKQGILLTGEQIDEIKFLTNKLLEQEKIEIYGSGIAKDRITSVAVFLVQEPIAYYLFGANNFKKGTKVSGTSVLWDSFLILSKRGINQVDLEGINSPNRGWFKTSFGGHVLPYYEVKIAND